MDTNEMLNLLVHSQNESIARTAKNILSGSTTIETELKYCGGFMAAVLKNDYNEALARADSDNYYALTGKSKYPYSSLWAL